MRSLIGYVRSLLGLGNEESRSRIHIKRDRIENDYSSDEEPSTKRFKDIYPSVMNPIDRDSSILQSSKSSRVRYIPIQVDPGHPSTSTPAYQQTHREQLTFPEVSWIEPQSRDVNKENSRGSRRIYVERVESEEEGSEGGCESDDDDVVFVSKEPIPQSARQYKFFVSKDPGLVKRVERSLAHKSRRRPSQPPPIQKVKSNLGVSKQYKKQSIPKWIQGSKTSSAPLKRVKMVNGNARSAIAEVFDLQQKSSYEELIKRATKVVAPKNVPASITTVDLLDDEDDEEESIKNRLARGSFYDKSKLQKEFDSSLDRDIRAHQERVRHTEYDPITVASLCSSDEEVSVSSPQSTSTSSSVRIERVNSLKDSQQGNALLDNSWLNRINEKYFEQRKRIRDRLSQAKSESSAIEKKNFENALLLVERKLRTQLSLPESLIEEPVEVVPELSDSQNLRVTKALGPGPANQLLADKFNLKIHRRDLQTLSGLNWLNDEVINFYMNLLMQRSAESRDLPRVYAANTFFYPKLMQSGQAGLKRWTKKVDVFEHDLLVIPVHLGVHWCMCLVDMKKQRVDYLDSMGGNNEKCVRAVIQYLRDEHQDKKGQPLDTTEWDGSCLKDIPQQMNGSDCGVFACTFAEFASRRQRFVFTQQHMPQLRRKMALEILEGKLIT